MVMLKIKKVILAFLLLAILMSFVSCSFVPFDEGKNNCEYQGLVYTHYPFGRGGGTGWRLYVGPNDVQKIGYTFGKAYKLNTVYATKEEPANFVVCAGVEGEDHLDPFFTIAYIREDLELKSILKVEFESISVEYYGERANSERHFDDFAGGITFYDLVGENNMGLDARPKNSEAYCKLYCSYPGIPYLKCFFEVLFDGEQYFLSSRFDSTFYDILGIDEDVCIKEYYLLPVKTVDDFLS